VIHSLGEKY